MEKSQSTHYSQILMVPKPDGTFRMCVDYRALNDCTADASWPIANIAEMFRRIGSQKPKIFGIMTTYQKKKAYSTLSQPLHQLLTDYNKTRRAVWTPESTAAFYEMKLAISKCTTMQIMSDTAPITLHTDASDYVVGGYLFQTVDGKDQLVAFVSKFFNKSQLRWSVIKKKRMEYSTPVCTYSHSCAIVTSL